MYLQLYSIHENKDAIALKVIDYEFFTKYHATDCHDKLSSLTLTKDNGAYKCS